MRMNILKSVKLKFPDQKCKWNFCEAVQKFLPCSQNFMSYRWVEMREWMRKKVETLFLYTTTDDSWTGML